MNDAAAISMDPLECLHQQQLRLCMLDKDLNGFAGPPKAPGRGISVRRTPYPCPLALAVSKSWRTFPSTRELDR